ncbi:MAG: methionyl-tRNA formyltransferase [Phycisphaerales bacterium]|nr:methionyl-tRNA formyltransferase [Phycisphaerales bacterium]
MKIGFLGSSPFALPTLDALRREHELVMVVTQPDRPAGRGTRTTPTPVSKWAAQHAPEAELYKPERIGEREAIERLLLTGADAWVVIAYGQKLPRALYTRVFMINLHASLLPRWRGAAPINAAILAGDSETGNCVITIAEKMDAGEVLASTRRTIEPDVTAGELHDLLASDGPEPILQTLDDFQSGTLRPVTQDESLVTHAPKVSRDDAWVDFSQSADACRRRINALSPRPGVSVPDGGQPLKLLKAAPGDRPADASPGTLLDASAGLLACGKGTIRLVEVQPAGKKPMAWGDFARGRRLVEGHTFMSTPR